MCRMVNSSSEEKDVNFKFLRKGTKDNNDNSRRSSLSVSEESENDVDWGWRRKSIDSRVCSFSN